MRLDGIILKILGRVKGIQPLQGCYAVDAFSMGCTHGYAYSTPFGVGSFRIDIVVGRLLKFNNVISKLKDASFYPLRNNSILPASLKDLKVNNHRSHPWIGTSHVYNTLPLPSLKGLNMHNHGWNPWMEATHCFNNPEGVEHQKPIQ